MKQVKGAGSQSAPAPANIAPQCGSEGIFHRGQKLPLGVGFGVVQRKNAAFAAEKGSPERRYSRSHAMMEAFENYDKEDHYAVFIQGRFQSQQHNYTWGTVCNFQLFRR